MRIVALPGVSDQSEEEIEWRLVDAIAREIWRVCGRPGGLDWLGVERTLAEIVASAQAEAAAVTFASGSAARAVPGRRMRRNVEA